MVHTGSASKVDPCDTVRVSQAQELSPVTAYWPLMEAGVTDLLWNQQACRMWRSKWREQGGREQGVWVREWRTGRKWVSPGTHDTSTQAGKGDICPRLLKRPSALWLCVQVYRLHHNLFWVAPSWPCFSQGQLKSLKGIKHFWAFSNISVLGALLGTFTKSPPLIPVITSILGRGGPVRGSWGAQQLAPGHQLASGRARVYVRSSWSHTVTSLQPATANHGYDPCLDLCWSRGTKKSCKRELCGQRWISLSVWAHVHGF